MQPAGYSGRPLAEKLGLKPGMRACLLNTPEGYRDALGGVVGQVEEVAVAEPGADLEFIHAFVIERAALADQLPRLKAALASNGMLWISWPKKAARVATDVDENVVRALGLAAGLVDVKGAAVDGVWSGLKFVYRLKDRRSAKE